MGKKQRPAGFGRKQVLNLTNQEKTEERYGSVVTGVAAASNPLQGLMQSYKSDSEEEDMDAKLQDFMKEIETVDKKESSEGPKKSTNNNKSSEEKPASDWQECFDEGSGYVYYWNMKTNAVTWEKPAEMSVQVVKGKLESKQLRRHKYDRNALLLAQNTGIPKRRRKSSGSDSSKSPVEEKIEMITSFGPASSDSDSDSDGARSKTKGKKRRSKTGSSCSDEPSSPKVFGPQLPPELKVMPQPPPGKTIGPRVKKSDANQQKPATVQPKESPVDSPKAQDDETDDRILNRLKKRLKQLQDLGGDIPDEMRKYLDKSGDTDQSLAEDIMSAIENEIPPDYKDIKKSGRDSPKPKETNSEVKLSFKVADRPKATLKTKSKIDIFAEDEGSDGSEEGDNEKKKENSSLLQYPEPSARQNLMKPRKFLDKTDIEPVSKRQQKEEKENKKALDDKEIKSSSSSESLFKYKKYQEDPSNPKSHRGFGYEGQTSHRKKGAPSFVKGDTLNDTYDPMEPTEDVDMDLGTSSDSSVDGGRRSFKRKGTEGFQEESKRRKHAEENRAEVSSESEVMNSKLEFLDVDKAPVPPVKVMLLQLQVLQLAWKSGSLSTDYFRNWLKKQHNGITELEQSVMPPGWSCLWDRQEKQYYYLNDATGEKQWVFPTEAAETKRSSDSPVQPTMDDPPPPGLRSPLASPPHPPTLNTEDSRDSVDDRPSISELLFMPPPPPPNILGRQSLSASPNSDIDGLPMEEADNSTYAPPAPPPAPPANDSFNSKLDDFYSEISALEDTPQVEAPPPPLPVEAAPQLLSQPPLPPLPPPPEPPTTPPVQESSMRKKLKRPKLSTGLALKKKNVPGLVAKWQKVQSQLTDPKATSSRF